MDKTSKQFLYLINTALELVVLISALVMFHLGKVPFKLVLNQVSPLWIQIAAGAATGLVIGILCGWLVTRISFFESVLELIRDMTVKYRLNYLDIVIISLTAAVCEEFLFRGALQRLWGVWPVSVLFILLHGYFNPRNLKMTAYGVIMLALSALIGYSYKYLGMYAAIIFHFVFDVAAMSMVKIKAEDKIRVQGL
jgi:membrane protease YdiL (CAAX protease family)